MGCTRPVKGYRAQQKSEKGKYPFTTSARYGNLDQPMDVRCGQCIDCKLQRSRDWGIRLTHEKQQHKHSMFLTLTYAPEKLPPHGSLRKKDFQDFMKRFRRWLKHKKIKYFYCGEYGENLERPHYHAIIFGHEFSDQVKLFETKRGDKLFTSEKLNQLWTHGHCSIGEVTLESASYVARYVTKKITGEKARSHYGEIINKETGEVTWRRQPEFSDQSNGLGKSWFNQYTSDVFPSDEVVIRGKKMKPPRYYSALYEQLEPEKYFSMKAKRIAASKKPEVKADNIDPRLRVKEEVQRRRLDDNLKRKF